MMLADIFLQSLKPSILGACAVIFGINSAEKQLQ